MKMDDSKKTRAPGKRYFVVAMILFLLGFFLLLFPFAKTFYYDTVLYYWMQRGVEETGELPLPPEVPQPEEEYPDKLVPQPAKIRIPKLDLFLDIGYGVEEEDLKKGPGIYPQSGYPDIGNVSIAGHRNAYGSPFWHLDKMAAGDRILFYYNDKIYEYRVEQVFETHSRDWSVIDPTEKPALTLTTCHPLNPVGGAYNRLIVRSYLVNVTLIRD